MQMMKHVVSVAITHGTHHFILDTFMAAVVTSEFSNNANHDFERQIMGGKSSSQLWTGKDDRLLIFWPTENLTWICT